MAKQIAETRSPQRTANDAARNKPLLLFFYSPTSGQCRRVEGFLAYVIQRRANHDAFILHRIDVSERPDLAERYQVCGVPLLCVISQKRIAARIDNPKSAKQIEEQLRPWLGHDDA